jgi:antitoxin component of MazEF toxin-antitoxin module
VKGRLKRKISTAGKKPIVYLPEDMVKAIDEKVGDEVDVYVKGKKS